MKFFYFGVFLLFSNTVFAQLYKFDYSPVTKNYYKEALDNFSNNLDKILEIKRQAKIIEINRQKELEREEKIRFLNQRYTDFRRIYFRDQPISEGLKQLREFAPNYFNNVSDEDMIKEIQLFGNESWFWDNVATDGGIYAIYE